MAVKLDYKLASLLGQAAELGAMKLATEMGLIKAKMSKAAAYKRYGRTQVERWIAEGAVIPVQKDTKGHWELDQLQLQALEMSKSAVQFIDI